MCETTVIRKRAMSIWASCPSQFKSRRGHYAKALLNTSRWITGSNCLRLGPGTLLGKPIAKITVLATVETRLFIEMSTRIVQETGRIVGRACWQPLFA